MTTWTIADYPGAAVRLLMLRKGDELGDIRIQHYGESVRVAQFLPGEVECAEGDTPKTQPERSVWFSATLVQFANDHFDLYVAEARADGWEDYRP